jgi:hypothetical protein
MGSDEEIEVAVVVEIRERVRGPEDDVIGEGIGGAGALDEARYESSARVLEEPHWRAVSPGDQVDITVAIEVREGRGAPNAESAESQICDRVGRGSSDERGEIGKAGILEGRQTSVVDDVVRDEIEVAVGVEIAERWPAVEEHHGERVLRTGAQHERRARRSARVLEIIEVLIRVVAEGAIEIAVGVEIAERRAERNDVAGKTRKWLAADTNAGCVLLPVFLK